ncbi:MAG: flippase activity-associated protein Agl23 [Haloarculaceae archaeon]
MAHADGRRVPVPRRVLAAVLAVTTAGLAARLVALGWRIAHWDEARVAYWALEAARTGVFEYRPIIHGPLLQHADRLLFGVLGPSDFAIRLPVAVVGGLLPLAALLFRARLDDRELAGLALLLAFDPTLLYYSRFMRSDVLVGAFCFLAFGLAVRAIDTGRRRYLVVAGLALGLGFASKENAIAYVACWLGALVVPLDHRLLLAGGRRRLAVLRTAVRDAAAGLARAAPALPFALLAFLGVVVWAYAPRDPAPGAVSLGNALADPSLWPAVIERATVGSARKAADLWVGMGIEGDESNGYPVFLGALLKDVGLASAATALLGIGGFLADRYSGDPRALPAFAFAWAAASLVGYPAITDIPAPWLGVHLVLPLAVPGAVALGRLAAWARTRAGSVDAVPVRGTIPGTSSLRARLWAARVPLVVLLLVALQLGGVGAYTAFVAPQDATNELAQYGQPAGKMRPALDRMAATAPGNDGPDVLLYGPFLVDGGGSTDFRQPGCARWFNALPLPWYTVRANATVTCAADPVAFPGDPPPVVIANASEVDATVRATLADAGYEGRTYRLRRSDTPVVVFFGPGAVGGPGTPGSEGEGGAPGGKPQR